jgi:endonuclease/exonuclease/phosphatase family metal-dependent hydrolase
MASSSLFSQESISSITPARALHIMSYNVENLFDTKHDEGKDDWTFLPSNYPGKNENCAKVSSRFYRSECFKTNWTEEHLQLKLQQIKKMVMSDRQKLPDLLALVEVENEKVVQKLANVLGYKKLLVTDSPDERGVDVALLYNLPSGVTLLSSEEFNLHELNVLDNRTRNILKVTFDLKNKETLSVYVNHWPSQGNPTEDRLAIADFLHEKIKEDLRITNRHILVVGDFNTLASESPNPVGDHLAHGTTVDRADKGILEDVYEQFAKLPDSQRVVLPRGTHFYSKERNWNHLDKFLTSLALRNTRSSCKTKLSTESFRIIAPSWAQTTYPESKPKSNTVAYNTGKSQLVPKRYNFHTLKAEEAGFSDHYPISLSLNY